MSVTFDFDATTYLQSRKEIIKFIGVQEQHLEVMSGKLETNTVVDFSKIQVQSRFNPAHVENLAIAIASFDRDIKKLRQRLSYYDQCFFDALKSFNDLEQLVLYSHYYLCLPLKEALITAHCRGENFGKNTCDRFKKVFYDLVEQA